MRYGLLFLLSTACLGEIDDRVTALEDGSGDGGASAAALEARVAVLETSSAVVETSVEAHAADLIGIEADLAACDADIAAVEVDIADVGLDIVSVEADIVALAADIVALDAAVTTLQGASGGVPSTNPLSLEMTPAAAPAFTYGTTAPVLVVTLTNDGDVPFVTNGLSIARSDGSVGYFNFDNDGIVGATTYSTNLCEQIGEIVEPGDSCDHVIAFVASKAGTTTVLFGAHITPLEGDGIPRSAYLPLITQVVNAP